MMMRLRPDHSNLEIENGLVFCQQPNTKKLVFESGTTDTFFFRRKSPLDLNEEFLNQYRSVERFNQVLKR